MPQQADAHPTSAGNKPPLTLVCILFGSNCFNEPSYSCPTHATLVFAGLFDLLLCVVDGHSCRGKCGH